jgi:hypothetical protein
MQLIREGFELSNLSKAFASTIPQSEIKLSFKCLDSHHESPDSGERVWNVRT